eukprot:159145-Rhodomonas_salina.3
MLLYNATRANRTFIHPDCAGYEPIQVHLPSSLCTATPMSGLGQTRGRSRCVGRRLVLTSPVGDARRSSQLRAAEARWRLRGG